MYIYMYMYWERKRDRDSVCVYTYTGRERAREQRTWSVARNCSFSSVYTNKSPPSKAAESTPPEAVRTKKKNVCTGKA
jgi:hypothetical protein